MYTQRMTIKTPMTLFTHTLTQPQQNKPKDATFCKETAQLTERSLFVTKYFMRVNISCYGLAVHNYRLLIFFISTDCVNV